MADIKNKNELKRRIDLFLDDFSHEEYMINEPFCKETMSMMREFIGHASHLLDCADAKIKKANKKSRNKAIDEIVERFKDWMLENDGLSEKDIQEINEIAEEMRGGEQNG